MATSFTKYVKHGVVETTDVKATKCGHAMNVRLDEDVDNGSFVALGDYEGGSMFKAVKPVAAKPVLLVASSEVIYEQYNKRVQEVENFFNAAGEPVRALEIVAYDRFALSKEAFADGQKPAVGKFVKIVAGYKAEISDTAIPAQALSAKIIGMTPSGNYLIFVEKNA